MFQQLKVNLKFISTQGQGMAWCFLFNRKLKDMMLAANKLSGVYEKGNAIFKSAFINIGRIAISYK